MLRLTQLVVSAVSFAARNYGARAPFDIEWLYSPATGTFYASVELPCTIAVKK